MTRRLLLSWLAYFALAAWGLLAFIDWLHELAAQAHP